MPKYTLLKGRTLSYSADPSDNQSAIEGFEQGAVLVDTSGNIAWHGDASGVPAEYKIGETHDFGMKILMPGFVDPHLHFPQFRMLACPGVDLMDWLTRFTFAEEAQYADKQHATKAADLFLKKLFKHGTTSAMAFSSVHKVAAEVLFETAAMYDMAITTGKTMMDRQAPAAVLDTAEQGAIDSQDLIDQWHGKGRAHYAITPRFAVTSTEEQLKFSGQLLSDNPTCLMQTHLSESAGEMALIAKDFPNDKDYTDVYDRFGLLSQTSVFGHGIHLSERETARLAESKSTITHCPTSNTFLGSGLMPMQEWRNRGLGVGIATDVGGGTSYSMLQNMAEAYKISMLLGHKYSAHELFYMATKGNAAIVKRSGEIGEIKVGYKADLIVLDPWATEVLSNRQALSETIEDCLFSLMFLGDDRTVSATFVAGKRVG